MSTTWTNPAATNDIDRVRVAKAACTTGTEAVVAGAAAGLDLKGLGSVTPHIELGAGAIGAGATLQAYLLNPATGAWNRAPELDVTLTAGLAAQGCAGFKIDGPVGRLQLLPNAVGAACSVYLNGTPRNAFGA